MIDYEIEILESTYNETMTIKRITPTVNQYNEDDVSELVPVVINQPCAVSVGTKLFNTDFMNDANRINYDVVLYCNPGTDVKSGDTIIVTYQNGRSLTYTSGEPYYYFSHFHVPIIRKLVQA